MSTKTSAFLKSLGLAVIVPVLYVFASYLNQGTFNFDWKNVGIVAGSALVGYLLQRLAPKLPDETP